MAGSGIISCTMPGARGWAKPCTSRRDSPELVRIANSPGLRGCIHRERYYISTRSFRVVKTTKQSTNFKRNVWFK